MVTETDILRRRSKLKESDVSEETYMNFKNSKSRLAELKSSIKTLGKEATKAHEEVDSQQQNVTYQCLHTLTVTWSGCLLVPMVAQEEAMKSSPKTLPLHLESIVSCLQEETNSNHKGEI
ncbi:hypothetical protein Bca52824_032801 [Brassica carinata]|uniref:Uncharacterized protein n=1 Tax=Brassica carinata TaxID=52824 RepID=A0A8X7SEV9_BRACI|nr:hypothetical protein Bca52824_032801 [Brassica carinata]